MIKTLTKVLSGPAWVVTFVLMTVGDLYWLWMSLKFGGFVMFALGLFPPTAIFFAAPVGAWSLVFGVPRWLANTFF